MNIYLDKLWEHEAFFNIKIFELETIYVIYLVHSDHNFNVPSLNVISPTTLNLKNTAVLTIMLTLYSILASNPYVLFFNQLFASRTFTVCITTFGIWMLQLVDID